MEKEFEELINKHQGIINKICNVYFYKSPYRDDYLQEILIRAWKSFPDFKKQSTFSTWLYRVTLNTAIDMLRKESIRPTYIELPTSAYNIPDQEISSESDRKEKLYSSLNLLSDAEKAIILLYLEDYNYKEISEIIGISESNTGVKINRIKNKLIKLMDDERRWNKIDMA